MRWPRHEIICLAGLLAEGNTCHPTSLYFFNTRRELIDDFARAAEQFPDSVARVSRQAGRSCMHVCVDTGRPGLGARAYVQGNLALAAPPEPVRSGAFRWARELGILGCKATQKRVPEAVFTLRDEDLELFLGRLWAGDGFISGAGNNQVPFYATSSGELAKDVRTLLLRFGILSGVHEKHFKYRGTLRPAYTVHLLGDGSIETFIQRIGPHCLGRESQLEALRKYVGSTITRWSSKDTLPVEIRAWVDEERKRKGISWKDIDRRESDQEGIPAKHD